MKILKYKKVKGNEYKITTGDKEYLLYDDIIISHELLLKKEITSKEWNNILKENSLLKAYYDSLKLISTKLRTEKELYTILNKKEYTNKEIEYAINRLTKEGYLNHKIYIEAYIHDSLNLKIEGERKIKQELEKLGLPLKEIEASLCKVDKNIYLEKIEKYINKKLKVNKKSANEFKRKISMDLINKGFNKEDIDEYLQCIDIQDNEQELEKIINKLYQKYISKYDLYTTKSKIKLYLYTKGYINVDVDGYLKRVS